jgi:hypothetical protein
MSNSTESNFRNSLRGFNTNSRPGGIQLPNNANNTGNPLGRTWASFTSGAADVFDNARRTVQGYVPVTAQEDVDEPWFQMSRWEVSDGQCLALSSC